MTIFERVDQLEQQAGQVNTVVVVCVAAVAVTFLLVLCCIAWITGLSRDAAKREKRLDDLGELLRSFGTDVGRLTRGVAEYRAAPPPPAGRRVVYPRNVVQPLDPATELIPVQYPPTEGPTTRPADAVPDRKWAELVAPPQPAPPAPPAPTAKAPPSAGRHRAGKT